MIKNGFERETFVYIHFDPNDIFKYKLNGFERDTSKGFEKGTFNDFEGGLSKY